MAGTEFDAGALQPRPRSGCETKGQGLLGQISPVRCIANSATLLAGKKGDADRTRAREEGKQAHTTSLASRDPSTATAVQAGRTSIFLKGRNYPSSKPCLNAFLEGTTALGRKLRSGAPRATDRGFTHKTMRQTEPSKTWGTMNPMRKSRVRHQHLGKEEECFRKGNYFF